MVKRIFKENEKKNQEETQDCQRSFPFILDLRHSEQPADFIKVQSPGLKKHQCHHHSSVSSSLFSVSHHHSSVSSSLFSVIITLPFSIFFLLHFARKASIICLLFIVLQICFNKSHLCYQLITGFSLFFELPDNIATHITWTSEEDPAELSQTPLRGSFKHSVGTERLEKSNSRKQMWYSRTQQPQQVLQLVVTLHWPPWLGPHWKESASYQKCRLIYFPYSQSINCVEANYKH